MISRRELLIAAPVAGAAVCFAAAPRNRVGCQTNAWQTPPEDFEAFIALLQKIKGMGYEGFEANVRYIEGQISNVKEARARIEKTGLRFCGAHMGLNQAGEAPMKSIDIAAAFGAERIVLSGSGLIQDGKLDLGAVKAKADLMNRTGVYCKSKGLRLTYHNHQGEFKNNSQEMEELLKQTSPATFNLLFDAGHAFLAGADVPAFFTRHFKRIDSMHMRDLKAGKQVPLGEGEFDQKPIAAAIRKTGWGGWLMVEEELRTRDFAKADKTIISDRTFIKKTFGA